MKIFPVYYTIENNKISNFDIKQITEMLTKTYVLEMIIEAKIQYFLSCNSCKVFILSKIEREREREREREGETNLKGLKEKNRT